MYFNLPISIKAPAKKPGEFTVSPNELDENQSITLNCSANVGGPPGNIQIWKIIQYPDTPELIYTSDSKSNITDSCQLINVTTTYIVTKKDHGAIFRCSSKNILTQGPEPRKESSRISVLCMYKFLNLTILYYSGLLLLTDDFFVIPF